MLIIIQNSSYNWVKGESELNQGWINGEKTLCCFRTTEPKILSFSTLTYQRATLYLFFIRDFFHTVLRHTCWKWVDTSTLIQLITFNRQSTSFDHLWKLIEILQHLKGVDSSTLILQYIYNWFSPILENWLSVSTAGNVLKIICHLNVDSTAMVQQFFNLCSQLLRNSTQLKSSWKLEVESTA